ncbi:MAG: hypothetical protein P1V13_22275 [Rhizobiaceae bacterium]|nr:hypothetical protein [Rhizobiaceae bacterium]
MFKYDAPEWENVDGRNTLSWTPVSAREMERQVAEAIAIDRDNKIRQSLIALGWTPPQSATPKDIAARGAILSAGPKTLAGMPITVDPDVPEGEVHLRHKDGRVDKIVLLENIPPRPKK